MPLDFTSRFSRTSQRRKFRRPQIELLEDRVVPVIGNLSHAPIVTTPGPFDGVASLNGGGTATLLDSGRHLITSGEVVDSNLNGVVDGTSRITFDLTRNGIKVPVTFNVLASDTHLAYTGPTTRDTDNLAILSLIDPVTGGSLIAPFGAQRYGVYAQTPGTNQEFTIVGYGATGKGESGQEIMEVQVVSVSLIGGFTLSFNGAGPTTTLTAASTSAEVAAALEAIGVGAGNVSVYSRSNGPEQLYFIRFDGQFTFQNVPQLVATPLGGATVSVATLFDGNQVGSFEVKRTGKNTYDDVFGKLAVYDFDPAGSGNATEDDSYSADAGGASFILDSGTNKYLIASITAFTTSETGDVTDYRRGNNLRAPDFSIGELDTNTLLAPYLDTFINPTKNQPYSLVLDMNKQVLGLDNILDDITITAKLENSDLVIDVVNNSTGEYSGEYFRGAMSQITSIVVRGGADNERFVIDASLINLGHDIRFEGGGGNNTLVGPEAINSFVINGICQGLMTSSGGNTTFGWKEVQNLIGGSFGDALQGLNYVSLWTITGTNQGIYASGQSAISYTNIETLCGGAADDTFYFELNGRQTGDIKGNAGKDTIVFAGFSPDIITLQDLGFIDGFDGEQTTRTIIGGRFFDINNIDEKDSGSFDKIVGLNQISAWVIDREDGGSYAYATNTLTFEGFETLQGGNRDDSFTFASNGLLNDSINGGDGTDKLVFAGVAPAEITLSDKFGDFADFNGSLSNAPRTILAGGFYNINFLCDYDVIDCNKLVGIDVVNTWTIEGEDRGLYTAGGRTLQFIGFESLAGRSKTDTFVFEKGGNVKCEIDGAGGIDEIIFNGIGSPDSIKLTGTGKGGFSGQLSPATLIGNGFIDIDVLTDRIILNNPSKEYCNQLIGLAEDNTWLINGLNSGKYTVANQTLAFNGYQSLTGNTKADTFIFQVGGYLRCDIDGVSGDLIARWDSIQFVLTSPDKITLTAYGADGFNGFMTPDESIPVLGGGFFNIDDISETIDSSSFDSLVGLAALNNWTIDKPDGGTYESNNKRLTFVGFESLEGGAKADVFLFENTGMLLGIIDGKAGNDALQFGNITLQTGVTAPADITLTMLGAEDGFDGTLPANSIIRGGFFNLNIIEDKSSNTARIIGIDSANEWAITGENSGRYLSGTQTFDFVGVESITGGNATDSFNLLNRIINSVNYTGRLSGKIDGNGGDNSVTFTGTVTPSFVQLLTFGSNGFDGILTPSKLIGQGFISIDAFVIVDDAGNENTLQGLDALLSTWTLTDLGVGSYKNNNHLLLFAGIDSLAGGISDDTFVFLNAGSLTGGIDGGGSNGRDWLDFLQYKSSISVILNQSVSKKKVAVTDKLIKPDSTTDLDRLANIMGVENVRGSSVGGDTMIGNGLANIFIAFRRSNYLCGNGGNDILIGGFNAPNPAMTAKSRLEGGTGDDLIIAGMTTYDNNATFEAYYYYKAVMYNRALSANQRAMFLSTGKFKLILGQTVLFSISNAPPSAPNVKRTQLEQIRVAGDFEGDYVNPTRGRDFFLPIDTMLIMDLNLKDQRVGIDGFVRFVR